MNSKAALSAAVPVAVIGAGTMGVGIAMVAATAGHPVLLYDAAAGQAEAGLARLRAEQDKLVARGRLEPAEASARLARIAPAATLEQLAPAGLVTEAIVENLGIKTELFRALEDILSPDTILATNTSSLSVTALAAHLRRPGRVAGMHFFNPATVLPLVEVVSGHLTEPAIADAVFATAAAWGKVPVRCGSTPGFIVNRVARPFYGEALRLLAEQATTPAALDAVMRESGGFRMGPCELTDLIGQDVNLAVSRSVFDAFAQDPRYRPSLVQQALVDARLLGRKSGRGFFDYSMPEGARPAVAEAPPGPRPRSLLSEGLDGPAAALVGLSLQAGLDITERPEGRSVLRVDGVTLALTDGRTATARMAAAGEPVVLFDLALDYGQATRVALTPAEGAGAEALAVAAGFFQALGKAVTVIDDTPGMAVMRTVTMLANEAADAVLQGVATAEDVDLSMIKGVNYPLGPLAWAEAIGPVRIVAVMDNLADAYREDRYRCSPWLRRRAVSGRPLLEAVA